MRRVALIFVPGIMILLLFAMACTGSSVPPAPTASLPTVKPTEPPPPATATSMPATATAEPVAQATLEPETITQLFEDFDANTFGNSSKITNEWLPLKPGMRYIYEGTSVEDDGTLSPHRIVINVTDLTKVIGGVRSVVTWDLDYSAGQLAEAELAFYAQDNEGRVWRMGEYPEAYQDGILVEAPTWIHGFEEARAGIMMQAKPQTGTRSYAQGWGPAVGWTDRGRVDQQGLKVCVVTDCYNDVLLIAETSQSEPNAQQLKYFARGVGNIKVGWRGAGEKTKEVLELVKIETLTPEQLAEVRRMAFELEKSAYKNSQDVYGQTAPMEQQTASK